MKYLLTLLLVLLLAFNALAVQKKPPGTLINHADYLSRGLFAWWFVDNSSGGPLLSRAGFKGARGSFTGSATRRSIMDYSTRSGGCLEFDGAGGYVNLGDNIHYSRGNTSVPGASFDNSWSLSAWIWIADISGTNPVFSKYHSDLNMFEYILIYFGTGSSDGFGLFHRDRVTSAIRYSYVDTASEHLSAGRWYHVAGAFSGPKAGADASYIDMMSVYINGKKVNDAIVSNGVYNMMTDTGRDAMIGAYNQPATVFFDGYIDDVRFFHSALTERQAGELYQTVNRPYRESVIRRLGGAILAAAAGGGQVIMIH